MANFSGKYVVQNKENVGAFLTAIGVGQAAQMMGGMMKQQLTIEHEGNGVSFTTVVGTFSLGTREFTLGETKDETLKHSNLEAKVNLHIEDNKLILTETPNEGLERIITKELLEDGNLRETSKIGDITAVSMLNRVAE
ncbi:fatty acid-binding protein, liver-like [Anneissia japonica]|uniref:fatty acid-binding protein, liver-like n=1 Tax=Anneissia japonica TaxID=1529436 RepID=UPI001425AA15|nr:fatty acid-binding protein, liver-like [Anneissia japonica]